jgi:hypothetical protein
MSPRTGYVVAEVCEGSSEKPVAVEGKFGQCPHCGAWRVVRKDGLMRWHPYPEEPVRLRHEVTAARRERDERRGR